MAMLPNPNGPVNRYRDRKPDGAGGISPIYICFEQIVASGGYLERGKRSATAA